MAGEIFHAVDYIVTVAVLLISLALGVYYALPRKTQTTTGEYFDGGRQMSVLPVATSMSVTYLSAITILGFPAEAYYYGIIFAYYCIGRALGFSLAALLYVPVLYPLKISSGNQYIGMRFKNGGLVKYACVMQIVCKIITSGTYLYGPAILVQLVTGIPSWGSLLICGLIATAYTTVGGYKAVIATDVFQAIIMILGLIAVLVMGLVKTGGWSIVWEYYKESGRTHINFTPDPFTHNNIWAVVLLPAITDSWSSGIMQAGVQRYSSMPTVEKARWILLVAIPPMVLMTTLATLMGIVAYGYYAKLGCDPMAAGQINTFNMIIPQLVGDILKYPGLPGLFISASICGALSNFSSVLNAIAGLCWEDLLSKKFRKISEAAKVRTTKLTAVIFGILSIGMGFIALNMTGTIMKIAIGLSAAGNIPIGLLFSIGIFFPRANWKNALVASLAGFATVATLVIGAKVIPYKHPTMPLPVHGCNAPSQPSHINGSDGATFIMNHSLSIDHGLFMDANAIQTEMNFTQTYITIGTHTKRTFLQKIFTISAYWYMLFGLLVGAFVSAMLSLIPGFFTTGVDKHLVFTVNKIFIRTNSEVGHETKQILKSQVNEPTEKARVLFQHPYDSLDVEEKQHLNGINS